MRESSIALALAAISFMMTVIWGGPLIRILHYFKVGDSIRLEAPERHQAKIGTPTMGGVMFVLPIILITAMLNAVSLIGLSGVGRSVLLPLGVMILFAALGAIDDWEKLRQRETGLGMTGRTKFFFQVIFAAATAYGLYAVLDVPQLYLPGFPREIALGAWVYIPMATFIIVASVNAVNFTDGLDGLAGLISATCFGAFGGIALLQGQTFLAQFCFTLMGAVFGFLWFNVHPAMLIMGDTGSLSLGAALGVVALMTGHWILLPIIAIIPVSEVLSVILQVLYFRITGGRRIFKMSPMHLHFELSGWSETQVVQRFWLVSLLFAMIGVALAVI
ncbi:MAG: phospho-N-acetylmuramoyl-pentapeptide-transferase [Chloroflexi bacterium]|nr:MAG: phospho-N-acetylmuramoyl-pentapeptide-transferase [Chloroflexota bacterium]MBL1196735.1 phospho-N-acetylmuramoyl-pentapeptide-transferase [Chloroflexota bacterium]NOH14029.1 phospho-N-acetylmuramoyl-pentapeptide-transferase [Chloroflexota bacterium]